MAKRKLSMTKAAKAARSRRRKNSPKKNKSKNKKRAVAKNKARKKNGQFKPSKKRGKAHAKKKSSKKSGGHRKPHKSTKITPYLAAKRAELAARLASRTPVGAPIRTGNRHSRKHGVYALPGSHPCPRCGRQYPKSTHWCAACQVGL